MKRLISVIASLLIAAAGACSFLALPTMEQSAQIEQTPQWQYASLTRLKCFSFVKEDLQARKDAGDNPLVMLGSSEFSPIKAKSHPSRFFAKHNYGFDTMMIGRGYCTSLWDALEVGALGSDLPQKKVVYFAGMTWFMEYQNHEANTSATFSPGAYDAYMANPSISNDLKARMNQRLAAYNLNFTAINPFLPYSLPIHRLDTAVGDRLRIARLTYAKSEERGKMDHGIPWSDNRWEKQRTPNWGKTENRLLAQAKEESTNDFHVSDAAYENGTMDMLLTGMEKNSAACQETPWNTREFIDLQLFLDTCKELGIEPLVIIQPVHGEIWDQSAWGRESRMEYYYKPLKDLCEQYGYPYVDGSEYEYTQYFFNDATHPGWLGWLAFDKAIYEFVMED